jgi:hypothetical protein
MVLSNPVASDMGRVALLESSSISVVVKTLVMASAGASCVNGDFDRLRKPISGDAVEHRSKRSCRFGAKSFNRRM